MELVGKDPRLVMEIYEAYVSKQFRELQLLSICDFDVLPKVVKLTWFYRYSSNKHITYVSQRSKFSSSRVDLHLFRAA